MTHTHMCKEDQDLFDFYSIPCYPSCMSTSVTRCWEKTDKQYNTNRILYNVDNDVLVQQGPFSPKYLQYTSHSLPEKDVWGIFCEIKGAFQKHFNLYIKYTSFNVLVRCFMWNFKEYLWKYLTHILKDAILYNVVVLRALRLMSSDMFLKCPQTYE